MKNFNDTIGNQTHDLPTCNAVPQTTATPRAPFLYVPSTNPGDPFAPYYDNV
jgi:hypothetical protein